LSKKGSPMERIARSLCICILITFIPCAHATSSVPISGEELCREADPASANLILNFLYWSYRRASATIQLQHILYEQLTHDLKQLEGFNHLRHNPERSLAAYKVTQRSETHMSCEMYRDISHSYVTCCKYALSDNTPLPHNLRDQLITVRSHIRGEISAIVATSLMETYHVLTSVYSALQTLYDKFGHLLFKSNTLPSRDSSLFSTIWSYMPSFVINVTYQFEDKHLELREHLCSVLLQDVEISDSLWKEIEQLRALIYQTLYTQTYHCLAQSTDDPQVFTKRFSTADDVETLPHPSELVYIEQG